MADTVSLHNTVDIKGTATVLNYDPLNEMSGQEGKRETYRLLGVCAEDQLENPLGSLCERAHKEWTSRVKHNATPFDFPMFLAEYAAQWENRRTSAINLTDKVTVSPDERTRLFGHADMGEKAKSVARWLYGMTKGKGASRKSFADCKEKCGGTVDKIVDNFIKRQETQVAKVA